MCQSSWSPDQALSPFALPRCHDCLVLLLRNLNKGREPSKKWQRNNLIQRHHVSPDKRLLQDLFGFLPKGIIRRAILRKAQIQVARPKKMPNGNCPEQYSRQGWTLQHLNQAFFHVKPVDEISAEDASCSSHFLQCLLTLRCHVSWFSIT